MRKYSKAWFSLEGALLWLVVLVVALSVNQTWFGQYFPVSEKNGWGRILAFRLTSAAHLVVAAAILGVMAFEVGVAKALRFILGIVAVCLGLYSFWSPGVMATSFPLAIGGLLAALKAGSAKSREENR